MSDVESEEVSKTDVTIELDDADVDEDVGLSASGRSSSAVDAAATAAASGGGGDGGGEAIEVDEEDNIPSREQCQLLTEQFADVTGTDTALAQFFLQDRQWDLQKSVNAFFESVKDAAPAPPAEESTGQPELLITFDSQTMGLSLMEGATVSTVAPRNFRLLTWNIDGLEDSSLKRRTKAVKLIIEKERADIVFLQEVVPVVYTYLEKNLPQYMFIASGSEGYFNATLLLRTTVYFDGHELIPFPATVMGRTLLQIEAHIGACKLRLLTSHLESTGEGAEYRKAQLKMAFERLSAGPSTVNGILAGDLNLRDREVTEVGMPVGVVDVWEATGSRKEVQYTWDLQRNSNKEMPSRYQPRCRFDRVYLRSGCGGAPGSKGTVAVARHFGLVGLQKVSGTQWYPSDHWGVLTHYDIVDST